MSALALDFTYRYPFASHVTRTPQARAVELATCSAGHETPHFFQGQMRQPRLVADLLLALAAVVRSHYYLPRPPQTDPVVTCNDSMLRFEGFSGCCGVYARVDLALAGFEVERLGRGTTNVDFNEPMRAALARLQAGEAAALAVGREQFSLSSASSGTVLEKKVRLPWRWIKGFSEVQAYAPRLRVQVAVAAAEARRFISSLPVGNPPKQTTYALQTGASLRLSQRPTGAAVAVNGLHRLRAVLPLAAYVERLRIWGDAASGVSAWELEFPVGRISLLLSPHTQRGFSGEGQLLSPLAGAAWQSALPAVRAQLRWQNEIDPAAVAAAAGLPVAEAEAALAALGACGLAGFDCASGHYFHRELPFDLARVEAMQPRLLNARALLAAQKVAYLQRVGVDGFDLSVQGQRVAHAVRLRPDLDRCSCPWFSKYQGERGPCKHILAARLYLEATLPLR